MDVAHCWDTDFGKWEKSKMVAMFSPWGLKFANGEGAWVHAGTNDTPLAKNEPKTDSWHQKTSHHREAKFVDLSWATMSCTLGFWPQHWKGQGDLATSGFFSSKWANIHAAWIGLAIWPAAANVNLGLVPKSTTGSNAQRNITSLGWRWRTTECWNSVAQDLTRHPNKPFSFRRWSDNPNRRQPHSQATNCDPHECNAHGAWPSKLRRNLWNVSSSVPKAATSTGRRDKAISSFTSQGWIVEKWRTFVTTCIFGHASTGILPKKGEVINHHALDLRQGQNVGQVKVTLRTVITSHLKEFVHFPYHEGMLGCRLNAFQHNRMHLEIKGHCKDPSQAESSVVFSTPLIA